MILTSLSLFPRSLAVENKASKIGLFFFLNAFCFLGFHLVYFGLRSQQDGDFLSVLKESGCASCFPPMGLTVSLHLLYRIIRVGFLSSF